MAHQRGHRNAGDLEVGATDVFIKHPTPHVPPRDDRPEWLLTYERRRPRWLMELFAEAFGVFLYCWGGMGSSAAFYTTTVAKAAGFGALLNVGLCYAFAIALAIIIIGPTSGSHLNPCFTICFAVFKGFPWRKVPQYIIAQITGGFIAGLIVYVQFKQPLDAITQEFQAGGLGEAVFSTTGPSSPIALYTGPGQSIGLVFVNEFVGAFVIAVGVFSVLDPSNIFVSPASAPLLIGLLYFVTITCFATQSVALNTARDLGGRMAAAAIWGRGAFPSSYTALACLTNIAASLVGALVQILLFSDSTRPVIHLPPAPATPAVDQQPMVTEKAPNGDYMNKREVGHFAGSNGNGSDLSNGSDLTNAQMHPVVHN